MNVVQDEEIVKSVTAIAKALAEIQKTLSLIEERLKGVILVLNKS